MSHFRHTILTLALATATLGAWAQADADHTQHHPNAPATEQSSGKEAAAMTSSARAEKMAAMDSQMKSMHEMHEKMMNAKTPEEKQALMAQHMKTMQDGMATMRMMDAGKGGMQARKTMPGTIRQRQQMMEKRMEMMETMMQMMMDRMAQPGTVPP